MKAVTIYTDGSCLRNPGHGGFGAVLLYDGHRKEISCGYLHTTNNRMELLAAIRALESLRHPCAVTLYSDSRYLVDSVNRGWLLRWHENNWLYTGTDKQLINVDLWKLLWDLSCVHNIVFVWVKGHASNVENERCDFLAKAAARRDTALEDTNYVLSCAKLC